MKLSWTDSKFPGGRTLPIR